MAFAYPVTTVNEVKSCLDHLRKEYFDARHHCYAYILGPDKSVYRVNDDGEPSGTGGRPIHGQLLSFELTNVLVVVVRYFGGVLLGASGLANAYKVAARDALQKAVIVERTIDMAYRLRFEYPLMNDVMRILKEQCLTPRNQQFDLACQLDFYVRKSQADRVYAAFANLRGVSIESI